MIGGGFWWVGGPDQPASLLAGLASSANVLIGQSVGSQLSQQTQSRPSLKVELSEHALVLCRCCADTQMGLGACESHVAAVPISVCRWAVRTV